MEEGVSTEKRVTNLVYRWYQNRKRLELQRNAMGQGKHLVLALGSTQQYSRQKYTPLRHVKSRI
jgi:hypothetical protein